MHKGQSLHPPLVQEEPQTLHCLVGPGSGGFLLFFCFPFLCAHSLEERFRFTFFCGAAEFSTFVGLFVLLFFWGGGERGEAGMYTRRSFWRRWGIHATALGAFVVFLVSVAGIALVAITASPDTPPRSVIPPQIHPSTTPTNQPVKQCPFTSAKEFCKLTGIPLSECPTGKWSDAWVDTNTCTMDCNAATTLFLGLGKNAFPGITPVLGLLRTPNRTDGTRHPDEPGHNAACRLVSAFRSHAARALSPPGNPNAQGEQNFFLGLGSCIQSQYFC